MSRRIFALCLILLATACKKQPDASSSHTPSIHQITVRNREVQAGSVKDTILISFDLSDPDGDIGNGANYGFYDIHMRRSDDTLIQLDNFLPPELSQYRDPQVGIVAVCNVLVLGSQLQIRDSTKTRDTIALNYYVVDSAGNKSNVESTGAIYLRR